MAERTALIEKLIDSYTSYFDIERRENDSGLCAAAEYHSRTSRYVLVKRAQLWAAENHEYVFIYSVSHLDSAAFEDIKAQAIAEGLQCITPHSEHMYSYITAIVIADRVDPDIRREIKNCRFRKNFMFSLHGWTLLRAAVLDGERDDVITNTAGKEVGKFLKKQCKE